MKKRFLKSQQGVSLVELILAMSIGLILLMAIGSLMVTSNKSAAQRTLFEESGEVARQVMSRLENNLLMAGYVDPFSDIDERIKYIDPDNTAGLTLKYAKHKDRNQNDTTAAATGLPNQFSLIREVTDKKIEAVLGCSTNELTKDPQSQAYRCKDEGAAPTSKQAILISFEAVKNEEGNNKFASLIDSDQEDKNSDFATGSTHVCNSRTGIRAGWGADDGNNNGSGQERQYTIITNAFSVRNGSGDEADLQGLYCQGQISGFKKDMSTGKALNTGSLNVVDGGTPTVLTNGVDQLTFRYLMTNENQKEADDVKIGKDPEGRAVVRYAQPHQVNTAASGNMGWSGVVGVEICLVVGVNAAGETISAEEMQELQPTIPQCLRKQANSEGNYPHSEFEDNKPRVANDRKYYRRYVRTIMMPNNLNVTSNKI